jgi:AcrR family transcriptional regulator
MPDQQGLRERKKRATRQAISNIATGLFLERGFDEVTVAEIAEAANVAKMTVFNYFPRKEDLFFDREEEGRVLLREALEKRSRSEPPLAALRILVDQLVEQNHPFAKFTTGTARFWQTVTLSPTLSARARELRDAFVTDLAEMLSDAVGKPKSNPEARLLASMLLATWQVAYSEGLRQHRKGAGSNAVRRSFINLIERGFTGITAAMRGTPYV